MPARVAGALGEGPQIVRARRLRLERGHTERGREHVGEPRELLQDGTQALGGGGIVGDGPLEDLEVHHRGVERAAQIVQQPDELGRQRAVRGPSGRARHQVRRADFTA